MTPAEGKPDSKPETRAGRRIAPPQGRWHGPWLAPAKLNLFLHITGRRADGYHSLETLFQFIDLHDEIWLRPTADTTIVRDSPLPGVLPGDDLVTRSAGAPQRASGVRAGVRIRVIKRIPIGAGLGGGSSDAATVLLALNRLWGCDLDGHRLAEIGTALGADVPVFLGGRAAFATGIGERLQPRDPPRPWYLLLDAGVPVGTADVFADAKLTRDTPPLKMSADFTGTEHNDCWPVVQRRFPAIRHAQRWLARHAPARLSGTGGCLFAAFDSAAAARQVKRLVPPPWRAWVCRGLNHHPCRRLFSAET